MIHFWSSNLWNISLKTCFTLNTVENHLLTFVSDATARPSGVADLQLRLRQPAWENYYRESRPCDHSYLQNTCLYDVDLDDITAWRDRLEILLNYVHNHEAWGYVFIKQGLPGSKCILSHDHHFQRLATFSWSLVFCWKNIVLQIRNTIIELCLDLVFTSPTSKQLAKRPTKLSQVIDRLPQDNDLS